MGLSDLKRQQAIVQTLKEKKRVAVAELAVAFEVSESSIRRDLTILEQKGLAKKIYGGAVPPAFAQHELSYQERLTRNIREKNAIATYAVGLVRAEQTLFLDSGTTAVQIAQRLPEDMGLTVVTCGLAIAEALGGHNGVSLFLLGGRYRPASRDLVGPTLVTAIKTLAVDIAFLSVDGFHPAFGLSTTDHELAEAVRAAMSIAQQKVVVSDSSKGGRRAFAKICPLDGVDLIITDKRLSKSLYEEIRRAGTEIVLV